MSQDQRLISSDKNIRLLPHGQKPSSLDAYTGQPRSRSQNSVEEIPLVSNVSPVSLEAQISESHVSFMDHWNGPLLYVIMAASFGSAFQHGYNTGVLNAPQQIIMDWIGRCEDDKGNTTGSDDSSCMGKSKVTLLWGVVVAIYCVGGMVGGIIVGFIADVYGRKNVLIYNNILVIVGGLLFGSSVTANSTVCLILGRFIVGVNSGINAGICPMYLSEISPKSIRGSVGTSYQLIITISILLSQILGMKSVIGTKNAWPDLLALSILPGIFQMITLPFCPKSPKFLLHKREDRTGASESLKWLRKKSSKDIREEMAEMEREVASDLNTGNINLLTMISDPTYRNPMIIAAAMMMAQQLTGINAAIFYSTSIFTEAGLDENKAQIATLCMGSMNVAMTFVSMVLVEKAGRKTLMLIGLSGMFVSTLGILVCLLLKSYATFFSYFAVVFVVAFVVSFAVGPGSIPWFFVTELFTSSARPTATSIAVVINWFSNFLVGLGFAPIMLAIGPYVFVIFMVVQAFFISYVWFMVPETKDKSVEEIAALFRKKE